MTFSELLEILAERQCTAAKLGGQSIVDLQQHFQDGRQSAFREIERMIREAE